MNKKYSNSPECPIEDILYLIQQDDIENIRIALLYIIDKSYPNGDIYLYEQIYSLYNSKNQGFTPKLLVHLDRKEGYQKEPKKNLLPSSLDSINFKGIKYLPTNEHVQVFVVDKGLNHGLLATINKNIVNDDYIKTLLKVYNQQVQLLKNKETDSLTGLLNRQSFDIKLLKLYMNLEYENRTQDNLGYYVYAFLDIDFFKSINDRYGHAYGDEVLILFSNMMKKTFRDLDMLFRYGGEEFSVLLNNVTMKQAETILHRFRKNIENITLPMENNLTVSIGYCKFSNQAPFTIIIERADKALYYSKEHGRNTISCYETLIENNEIQDFTIDEGDVELF